MNQINLSSPYYATITTKRKYRIKTLDREVSTTQYLRLVAVILLTLMLGGHMYPECGTFQNIYSLCEYGVRIRKSGRFQDISRAPNATSDGRKSRVPTRLLYLERKRVYFRLQRRGACTMEMRRNRKVPAAGETSRFKQKLFCRKYTWHHIISVSVSTKPNLYHFIFVLFSATLLLRRVLCWIRYSYSNKFASVSIQFLSRTPL